MRAAVDAFAERLLHDRLAGAADLRRTTGVDLHDVASSFFRFDAQPVQEAAPRGVRDLTRQHAARQANDVEGLDVDAVVPLDEGLGDQDVHRPSLLGDVEVMSRQDAACLLPTPRTPLAAAEATLGALQREALDRWHLMIKARVKAGRHLHRSERKLLEALEKALEDGLAARPPIKPVVESALAGFFGGLAGVITGEAIFPHSQRRGPTVAPAPPALQHVEVWPTPGRCSTSSGPRALPSSNGAGVVQEFCGRCGHMIDPGAAHVCPGAPGL